MRFSDLDGAIVGVWGAGREIRSFASQLARRLPEVEIRVIALDDPPTTDVRRDLGLPDAEVAVGADAARALKGCDVVVRSPGVSIHRAELVRLREVGIEIATATGLWLAERRGTAVIGITGTKGKSTTASLAYHIAQAAGHDAHIAGNIGLPALDLLDEPPEQAAIIELSSYQTADLTMGPEVIVFTNLYREHVDWHGSEEVYRRDKLRALTLPGVRAAVLNFRERPLVDAAAAPTTVFYGYPGGWDASPSGILRNGQLQIASADLPLRGEHNALNLCAALTALETLGLELPALPDALRTFRPLAHRLDIVAERDGVIWVDDSISTTPESALAAIGAFADREIILIGGGTDRGQDYEQLARALSRRRAAVIGIPTTGRRLVESAIRAGVPTAHATAVPDLNSAVARAVALAQPGTAVLLSPAAASYDTYSNFEERGDHFRQLVQSAIEREPR